MARIRSIKPDFFFDEETATLHPDAQLLLLGLSTQADRDGRLEDRPVRLKAALFPYRDVDVEARLADLVSAGAIVRYEAHGRRCIALVHWERDQKPHPKETSLGLPEPSTESHGFSRQGPDVSRRVPMVVGCGSGNGCGSISPAPADAVSDGVDDLPDATDDAVPDERPVLTLAPAEPDRPPEPKKTKAAKPKPPADPRGDPRHRPLTDALVTADAEVTGRPYAHRGGRDAKAVSECLALADQDAATSGERAHFEVLRRWRIARRWRGFPACNSLSDLSANWNAYAREQSAVAPTNLRAPVRAETQPQYDPSKPSCVTLTGRDAI